MHDLPSLFHLVLECPRRSSELSSLSYIKGLNEALTRPAEPASQAYSHRIALLGTDVLQFRYPIVGLRRTGSVREARGASSGSVLTAQGVIHNDLRLALQGRAETKSETGGLVRKVNCGKEASMLIRGRGRYPTALLTTLVAFTALIGTAEPALASPAAAGPRPLSFNFASSSVSALSPLVSSPSNASSALATAPSPAVEASLEEVAPYSKNPSEITPYELCPPPTRTRASCMAIGVPNPAKLAAVGLPRPSLEGSGEGGGFSPADLRSAYELPEEAEVAGRLLGRDGADTRRSTGRAAQRSHTLPATAACHVATRTHRPD